MSLLLLLLAEMDDWGELVGAPVLVPATAADGLGFTCNDEGVVVIADILVLGWSGLFVSSAGFSVPRSFQCGVLQFRNSYPKIPGIVTQMRFGILKKQVLIGSVVGALVVSTIAVPATAVSQTDTQVGGLRVVDSTGKPISGVQVRVLQLASEKKIRKMKVGATYTPKTILVRKTNTNGSVAIPRSLSVRPQGSYEIQVHGSEYNPGRQFVNGRDLTRVLTRSSGPAATLPPIVLHGSRVGAGLRRTTLNYGKTRYTKLREKASPVSLATLRSTTPKGRVQLQVTRNGSTNVGVGVKLSYKGQATFTQQATRNLQTGGTISLLPLNGVGTKNVRTSGYFVRWKLEQTAVENHETYAKVHHRSWEEWRPEGWNGGDLSTTSRAQPSTAGVNLKTRCSGKLTSEYGQAATRGTATTNRTGASLAGIVSLSSQAGYSQSIRVVVKAQKKGQSVRACGNKGPALRDPGQIVVVG